jgi:uncharacterized SAM-binding protein YcdF (DUF218 family)
MLTLLRIKTLLKNALLPPMGPLLLAAAGIFLLRRRPRLARACLMVSVGSLWLLSTPVVSDALASLAERYPPLDFRAAADAQAIVVLGGGGQRLFAPEYGGPAADPLLLERLSYGAYVSRKTGLPVLVTGWHIEAVAMRETLLRNFDIHARWVDDQAYDTFENARNSARLLEPDGVHRIVLVTRATHMRRSAREFTAAGLDVTPAPVGMVDPRANEIAHYLPSADALLRAYGSLNELLGEPLRALLAASHLRRQTSGE